MDANRFESLSSRQRECLRLTFAHKTAKEIARTIDLSEETVKTHLKRAREHLGFDSSRKAAVALAAHEQLSLSRGDTLQGEMPHSSPCDTPLLDWEHLPASSDSVREPLSTFSADSPDQTESLRRSARELNSLQIIGWIALIALALMLLIVASLPMIEAFSDIANRFRPS